MWVIFILSLFFSVLGIQGHLWSETALTDDNFYYLVFPRLLALAERAWHKANWESSSVNRHNEMMKDWDNFASGVGSRELKRLDDMGINYRVSPPGARYSSYMSIIFNRSVATFNVIQSEYYSQFVISITHNRSWKQLRLV